MDQSSRFDRDILYLALPKRDASCVTANHWKIINEIFFKDPKTWMDFTISGVSLDEMFMSAGGGTLPKGSFSVGLRPVTLISTLWLYFCMH